MCDVNLDEGRISYGGTGRSLKTRGGKLDLVVQILLCLVVVAWVALAVVLAMPLLS